MKRVIVSIATLMVIGILTQQVVSMGFLERVFGRGQPPGGNETTTHSTYYESLRAPAIHLVTGSTSGMSKLGGLPVADAALAWPSWQGKPMSFLGQIDLAAIPRDEVSSLLPQQGVLYFFYDQQQGTWGFDPKDRGSWKVIYRDSASAANRVPPPPGLVKEAVFKERPLTFRRIDVYPDWQDERIAALKLTDPQFDAYIDLTSSSYEDQPAHQMLGYPAPIQGNDMDLESQLASNGVYMGDATGYHSPQAKALESGRSDWVLLLQLDSDDAAGMMWGDVGRLYFWIRKSDLVNRNFDNVWMILQCS